MFTAEQRSRIRDDLVELARADPDVVAAAIVGSAARNQEGQWSDIDLALRLAEDADEPAVVERWTRHLDQGHAVADTCDVFAGTVRYRVFLLSSSLQVDVSFWPNEQFRASQEGFRLMFGSARPASHGVGPDVAGVIGTGWLYALHVRSALARGRLWQAAMMLDQLRDQVVFLACHRHGLDPWHGRDVDKLPASLLRELTRSRATQVNVEELQRSKRLVIQQFLRETEFHTPERAAALREPLDTLAAAPPVGAV